MRVRKLLTLAAAAAALVTTMSPATPAAAQGSATNLKTQFLSAVPWWDPVSCVERTIYLDAGSYAWDQVMDDRTHHVRTISLGADTYTWKDCLAPQNGFYVQITTLDPHNPAWQTAVGYGTWSLTDSRTYTWGSRLTQS